MRKFTRSMIVALAAMLVVALMSSAATARTRVEVSTTASLLSGRLVFTEPGGGLNVRCEVTLHVTMLRLINKVRLEHVGDVTAVLTANCRDSFGFRAQARPLVPMAVTYETIIGRLPTIERVRLWIVSAFLLETGPFLERRCLYRGLVMAESNGNPAETFTPVERSNIVPLWEDILTRATCFTEGTFSETLRANPAISIRLLER